MKYSVILMFVFSLALSGAATAHELTGNITVNKIGAPYTECVREASKGIDRGLAKQLCACVFKQAALHDHEDRPKQGVFLPISKHLRHAVEVCKARHDRG